MELKEDYEIDVDAGMNETSYYHALIMEEFSAEYTSGMEREFLESFGKLVEESMILCLGCSDGRELRPLGRKDLTLTYFHPILF